MAVLVLDQSSTCTGWVLCSPNTVTKSGFWKLKGKNPIIRIASLEAHLSEMFAVHPVEMLVIEDHTHIRQCTGATAMVMGGVWYACLKTAAKHGAETAIQHFETVKSYFGVKTPKGKGVTDAEKIAPIQMWTMKHFKLPFYPQADESAALIHAAYWMAAQK